MSKLTKSQADRLISVAKKLLDLAKNEKRVRFSIGMSKAREVRDIVANNGGQISSGDLKQQKYNLQDLKLSHLVTPQGILHHNAVHEHIENQPKQEYTVKSSVHGIPVDHLPIEQQRKDASNIFLQRHSPRQSQLLSFETTPDLEGKLKGAGVWDTFTQFNDMSQQSGHPANKKSIGWVRYDEGDDGVHVDEIQSDIPKDFDRLVSQQKGVIADIKTWSPEQIEQARKYHPQGSMMDRIQTIDDSQIEQMAQQIVSRFPPDHFQKIHDILFEGKEPSHVLHEAFLQHLRDEGKSGKKVHLWTPESKGKIALSKPDQPVPVHMKVGYGDLPKKMGYKPSQYGLLHIQDNPDMRGRPTQELTLRKSLRSLLKREK